MVCTARQVVILFPTYIAHARSQPRHLGTTHHPDPPSPFELTFVGKGSFSNACASGVYTNRCLRYSKPSSSDSLRPSRCGVCVASDQALLECKQGNGGSGATTVRKRGGWASRVARPCCTQTTTPPNGAQRSQPHRVHAAPIHSSPCRLQLVKKTWLPPSGSHITHHTPNIRHHQ